MTPEHEALRLALQTSGANLIRTDVQLGFTFLDVAREEFKSGHREHGLTSLYHANRAFQGASQMLRGLPKLGVEERAIIEDELSRLKQAADQLSREVAPPPEAPEA